MKLIICFDCYSAFTPNDTIKQCNCGNTSAIVIEQITTYSGNAKAFFIDNTSILESEFIDQSAIKNEDSKLTKKQLDDEFCMKVIQYLNAKADTDYRVSAKATNALIIARREEHKCTLQDFYRIIDNKVIQWKGNDYAIYLRPMTLFNRTKFINYLGEKGRTKQATSSNFEKFTDAAGQAKRNILSSNETGG